MGHLLMGVYIGSSIKLNCLFPWFLAQEDLHRNVWLLPRLAHILHERIRGKMKVRSGFIKQLLCAVDFCLIPLTSPNKCIALQHSSEFTLRTPRLGDIEHLTSGVSYTPPGFHFSRMFEYFVSLFLRQWPTMLCDCSSLADTSLKKS